jgi:uncharacterized protein
MKSARLGVAASVIFSLSPCLGAPIHDAARHGDPEAVARLLQQGNMLEARDETGETPLLAASLAGRPEVVAVLIKRGAEIGARNDRGLTPLHAAAYTGSIEVVRELVQAGAKVNDAENNFKVTPLIVAAEEDHADVATFLVDQGADVTWTERGGYTATSRAVFRHHWQTVDALLKKGAKCQDKDSIGFWAAECDKRMAALPR